MKPRYIRLLYIGLLLLIAILTVTKWYWNGNLIGYGDEYWLANPSAFVNSLLYIWSSRYYSAGWVNFNTAQLFPITVFWVFLKYLGFSLFSIQFIWFVLINFLPGLSSFTLIEYVLKKNYKNTRFLYFCAFCGALFYSYNLVLVQLLPYQPHLKPVMIGAPLIVLFTFRYLDSGRSMKYALYIALSSLIFAQSNVNIAYTVPVFGIVFLILLYDAVIQRKVALVNILFLIKTYFFVFLFNLWWIFPLFLARSTSVSGIRDNLGTWNSLQSRNTFDYFRFLGFWAWEKYTEHYFYFPYHAIYENFFMLVISFSFIALALLAVILKNNKITKFFFVFLILGLFLAKGAEGPFGNFFTFSFSRLPLFWIFRDPFSKFCIYLMLPMSVLFSISLSGIFNILLDKKVKYILVVLVPLFIIINSFPIFLGLFINKENSQYMRSHYIDIPDYWEDYASHSYHNIMVGLPTLYGSKYDWTRGFNGDPAIIFTPNELYKLDVNTFTLGGEMFNQIYYGLLPHSDTLVKNFLNLFSINKIALPSDIIYSPFLKEKIADFYEEHYELIQDGPLKLFSIPNSTPEIYSVTKLIKTSVPFKDSFVQGLGLYSGENQPTYFSSFDSNDKLVSDNIFSAFYIPIQQVLDYKTLPNYITPYLTLTNNIFAIYQVKIENDFPEKLNLKIKSNNYSGNGNVEPHHNFKLTVLNGSGVVLSKDFSFQNFDGWISLDELNLEASEYYFVYTSRDIPKEYNIDISKPAKEIHIQRDSMGIVTADHKENNLVYEIPNFSSNKSYLVNIDYDLLQGASDFILVQTDELTDLIEPMQEIYLCEPQTYSGIKCDGNIILEITPQIISSKGYFLIRLTSLNNNSDFGKIKLRKILVRENTRPQLVLATSISAKNQYATVDFKRNSPTNLDLSLSNIKEFPTIVVFTNSYYSGWRLKIGNRYIPESQHIQVNGYANAWIVNSNDVVDNDSSAKIEFKYQEHFRFAFVISLISILLITSLIFVKNIYVKKS